MLKKHALFSTSASISSTQPSEAPALSSSRSRVLWGIEGKDGIAEAINRTPAQTRYLISRGRLRVKKHGHRTYSALEEDLREDCAGKFRNSEH